MKTADHNDMQKWQTIP